MKLRTSVHLRDRGLCAACGITAEKWDADHIEPRKLRPDLDLSLENLQTLCTPCHTIKTTEDTRRIRAVNTTIALTERLTP